MILTQDQTIILGDCLEVLKTMDDKFINILITSPPYNLDIQYNSYEDKRKDYLDWLYKIFSEVKRVLKDDGSIYLNVGSIGSNPWVALDVAQKLRDLFILQNHIIWCKNISLDEDRSYGHYKPVISQRYLNHTFENIFHFTKTGNVSLYRKAIGVKYVYYKENVKEIKSITDDCRCRGNVWFIPYETILSKKERGNHPATFLRKLL